MDIWYALSHAINHSPIVTSQRKGRPKGEGFTVGQVSQREQVGSEIGIDRPRLSEPQRA